jgi:hypothetical protein
MASYATIRTPAFSVGSGSGYSGSNLDSPTT